MPVEGAMVMPRVGGVVPVGGAVVVSIVGEVVLVKGVVIVPRVGKVAPVEVGAMVTISVGSKFICGMDCYIVTYSGLFSLVLTSYKPVVGNMYVLFSYAHACTYIEYNAIL